MSSGELEQEDTMQHKWDQGVNSSYPYQGHKLKFIHIEGNSRLEPLEIRPQNQNKLQYRQETSMDCDGSLVTALYTFTV